MCVQVPTRLLKAPDLQPPWAWGLYPVTGVVVTQTRTKSGTCWESHRLVTLVPCGIRAAIDCLLFTSGTLTVASEWTNITLSPHTAVLSQTSDILLGAHQPSLNLSQISQYYYYFILDIFACITTVDLQLRAGDNKDLTGYVFQPNLYCYILNADCMAGLLRDNTSIVFPHFIISIFKIYKIIVLIYHNQIH